METLLDALQANAPKDLAMGKAVEEPRLFVSRLNYLRAKIRGYMVLGGHKLQCKVKHGPEGMRILPTNILLAYTTWDAYD